MTVDAMAPSALRGSCPPGTHTWVTGPGIVPMWVANSFGNPKGSLLPETKSTGTVIDAKCSTRNFSG